MAKTRIEVCADKESAKVRRQWLKIRGYSATKPQQQSKVIWDATRTGGVQDIASDDDDSVWVVIGIQ